MAVSRWVLRVRFLRLVFIFLGATAALAASIAALAFVPAVQTWIVARALAGYPDFHPSVGSVSVGFSKVRIENLRLQHGAVVLTLPALDATLPVKLALWDRRVRIRSLVAKGWTLDLSGRPVATEDSSRATLAASSLDQSATTAAKGDLAQTVAREFHGLLGGWAFPCDLSLDDVTLEGAVLVPAFADKKPTRLRAKITAGGMVAGRGDFTLEAAVPASASLKSTEAISLRGRIAVALDSPRTISGVAFEGRLSSSDGSLPAEISLSAHIAAANASRAESYGLELRRRERHLASLTAIFSPERRRFEGKWTLEVSDAEVAGFSWARSLPLVAMAGEGDFEADPAFAQLHASGRARAALDRLAVLAPALAPLGAVSLETDFALVHAGRSVRVDRVSVSLTGARPIASAHSVQPFACDQRTGELKVTDAGANWLEGSIQGIPLRCLSGIVEGVELSGGDVTGNFGVTATDGRFAFRSQAPLVASGISVQRGGRMLARDLDLSLPVFAERTPQGWQFQSAPLILSSGGRRLATISATVSPSTEARVRCAISGTWDADLAALASQPAFAGAGAMKGRSSTGDFSVRVGSTLDVRSTINLLATAPDYSVTAGVRAYFDGIGGSAFQVPVTITVGKNTTSISADGRWTKGNAGSRAELEVSGVKVDFAHLSLLAASLADLGIVAWPALPPGGTSTASVRDRQPFWGDWTGRVKFDFYSLRAGTDELNEVAGTLGFDPRALRLEGGRALLAPPNLPPERGSRGQTKAEPPRNRLIAEGAISFDAAAESPYQGKATIAIDVVDAARLFTAAQAQHDPVIEGRFSIADTLTGNGINWQNLLDRRREEFHLASKGGIIRLLKTDVAQSLPENSTPTADTLAKMGSLVGALFGVRKDAINPGINHLSKATEAVLDFSSQIPEIRYDDMTITAIREAGRAIQIAEIAISAQNERLTGSGEIGCVEGLPLRAQPLGLDLKLSARGRISQLLSTADLLSPDKDAQGYTLMRQPIHFGGTLEQIDNAQWHDLLVKAATPTPVRGKKGG